MTFRVLSRFTDLQDGRHIYNAGDIFPRAGLSVSMERLTELSSSSNRRGIPLIERVPDEDAPTEAPPLPSEASLDSPTGERPSEESEGQEKSKETPRKTTRGKKNAGANS